MKAKTVIVGASIGVGIAAASYLVGMGIGATVFLVEEEVKKREESKTPAQAHGPKVEKIRNPIKRNKTNKAFDDIVDKY